MPEYFHVTSSLNRASIEEHGLDWTRMSLAHGVAGVFIRPEEEGIFLCENEDEAEWFAQMAIGGRHAAVDVWAVSLPEDAEFIEVDSGYAYFPNKIPRSAIRLVRSDWSPTSMFED